MSKRLWLTAGILLLATISWAQFSFLLIDNFETGGVTEKWWRFGNLKIEAVNLPSSEARDLVAGSGGDYGLRLAGGATDWYVGGVGTVLDAPARSFSRLQLDIRGNNDEGGKLGIELFSGQAKDEKSVAEAPILGQGVTRISIPLTAFRLVKRGNNPDRFLTMQLVAIAGKKDGRVDCTVDNILLTN